MWVDVPRFNVTKLGANKFTEVFVYDGDKYCFDLAFSFILVRVYFMFYD